MSTFGQLAGYGRFAWALRGFLRQRATAELGREGIRERLRNRETNFLAIVKRAVYGNDGSPYLPLLRMAGCQYGDLERMVRSDGIERALTRLRDAGVYVTIEEFKGREPIVRGSVSLQCCSQDFNNPFLTRGIATSSSGSRGKATASTMNLERTAYHALGCAVAFSAHRLVGYPTVLWMPILPSAAGLAMLLHASKMGVPPARWFSPVAAQAIRPSATKRLATLYVVYAGRLFGTRMPVPEYVSGDQTHIVADCLSGILRRNSHCVVFSTPSSAVRLCQLARARGQDVSGVTFVVGGEPLSSTKMAEIRAVGSAALNLYAFSEGGIVGFSCADQSAACDDIHVLRSSQAVIQHTREAPFGGGQVNALLFTSLLEKSAKTLLNVENGDYGVLENRACGCELGDLGLTQHLHTVRSFDKLTGEGMTFVGTELVHVIEDVLPKRFGGCSTDYQMVESEDVNGGTRLDVMVSPSVGLIDDDDVVRTVMQELSSGGETNRMMAEVWRQGHVLRVRRENPFVTTGGKLLPLHILKEKTT